MSEQLGLPGIGGRAEVNDRLFFALLPQPGDAARIFCLGEQLRREAGLKGKPTPAERLHVSLHGLGDHACLPEPLIEAARRAGDAVSAPQFEIVFDRAGSFGRNGGRGPRPFVLRSVDDLDTVLLFHRALARAMARTGLKRWIAPHFTPHMTLLYDRRIAPQRAIETVRFSVCEFVLVHGLPRQGRHIQLARWPLGG